MTEATKELKRHEAQAPERTTTAREFRPDVDIIERADAIELVADLPGVTDETLDITFEDRVLSIYGRVADGVPGEYCEACGEYGIGDYRREFTVSDVIDASRIEASLKDGVLRLVLPKAEHAKARKIEIKAAG